MHRTAKIALDNATEATADGVTLTARSAEGDLTPSVTCTIAYK